MLITIIAIVVVAGGVGSYLVFRENLQPLPSPTSNVGKLVEIDMSSKQFRYDPKIITPRDGVREASSSPPSGEFAAESKIVVLKGDRVKIRITSTDVVHGFGLLEYDINKQTPPGETVTVEFVADKEGTFTFFCTVFCGTGHPQHKGTLIVKA